MKATSEELAIFVAVVESGSFSRAAEQLGQANSAVSRAVKKLEMKLGVSLLNRTTRQLSLTEEGERYFRRVQQILQEMAAAETEIMESRNTPRGLLRIDAATPVMLHFLMPLIKPFRERYPEITLSLVSSETFINLIERKVDVAIRAGMIDKEIARGELVELLADKRLPVEMPFSAVYYSDRAVSTRIRAFIDFLSEYIRTAPAGAVKEG
ncbi:LysR family transcriptional regulator [Salmonella enterica]|nr:LysR family transcriptional regulator [Salmonella enterica]